jgi:hypothetical protein
MSRSEGAVASKSVLVKYFTRGYGSFFPFCNSCSQFVISRSPVSALSESFKNRHTFVCIFSFLTLCSGLFSSLAASYFQIIPSSQLANVTVDVSGRVGLGYANISDYYSPYIAGAGVSVMHRCLTRQ